MRLVAFFFFLVVKLPLQSSSAHFNETHRMAIPYLIPQDHPIKEALDDLFSQSRATENESTLLEAGFEIVAKTPISFIIVTRHFAFPGYIFKIYLDSETRTRKGVSHWKRLLSRCIGAQKIRKLIQEKQLCYFEVPDKWLYTLPEYPLSREKSPQSLILIETDMEIENAEVTKSRWRSVKREHLDELFEIFKRGYGSVSLIQNVPYTKNGKFAFIDTEYPRRVLDLRKVKKFLPVDMQSYWDSLIGD